MRDYKVVASDGQRRIYDGHARARVAGLEFGVWVRRLGLRLRALAADEFGLWWAEGRAHSAWLQNPIKLNPHTNSSHTHPITHGPTR